MSYHNFQQSLDGFSLVQVQCSKGYFYEQFQFHFLQLSNEILYLFHLHLHKNQCYRKYQFTYYDAGKEKMLFMTKNSYFMYLPKYPWIIPFLCHLKQVVVLQQI